jgi:ribosome-associated protein YbcJ (S4-like RNA binding protein)
MYTLPQFYKAKDSSQEKKEKRRRLKIPAKQILSFFGLTYFNKCT